MLHVGLVGKEIFGEVGGRTVATQFRENPSAATFISLIKLIVIQPLDTTTGGIFAPEKGPPIKGELVSGPSNILTMSLFSSVSKKVKVIVIETVFGGQMVKL